MHHSASLTTDQPSVTPVPDVMLVGAGVVGISIAQAHVLAGISFTLADQQVDAVKNAVSRLEFKSDDWQVRESPGLVAQQPCVHLIHALDPPQASVPKILIESIPERLNLKQDFFRDVQRELGPSTVLCTNTSTLRINQIAKLLTLPEKFCGMHFFMPVVDRHAVEWVPGEQTSDETLAVARRHILRLNKQPLPVRDRPGFVVNRLLSPYLNEALSLLCQCVSAEAIESAAKQYGMPMSPLELIDAIGARTMFDAGRSYWQSFPSRLDPSPLLPALIKARRGGKDLGGGLYDYDSMGQRSASLSQAARKLVDRYQIAPADLTGDQLVDRLAIPMWVEAAIAVMDQSVSELEVFNAAMAGGLAYQNETSWLDFFDTLGSDRIRSAILQWRQQSKSIAAPDKLVQTLRTETPQQTLASLISNS